MTCKKTLHGRFASGRFTPVLLFSFSLLLMLSAFWFPASDTLVQLPEEPSFMCGVVSRLVSVMLYAISAVLISAQTFFDRQVRWVGALYLCMVAVLSTANGNSTLALSSLLFVSSCVVMFICQHCANHVGLLYTAFMILGFMVFVTPYALLLLPLYLLFCFFANVFSPRGIVASLLGLATPFWLILGTEYVLSGNGALTDYITTGIATSFTLSFGCNTLHSFILMAFALLLLLPAMTTFMGSAYPAKPLLRRRLLFIMVADAYLLMLCCLAGDGFMLFYFWQLPCLAVLASYLFSGKESKLMNIYFVLINIIMVAIATVPLWLKQ
ncbi:MAG: hypothetical protein IIW75_09125 [Bacteroidaceae bacterium]|nr:hypothetical protein [Bacteroidaceae bacterium]